MSGGIVAFLEYITVVKSLSSKSIEAYRSDLLGFENHIKKNIIDSNLEDIVRYLCLFKNKNTINRKISSINLFFNFCIKNRFIDKGPKLTHSKTSRHLPNFLSFSSIKTKLKKLDGTSWIDKRDYALILFLYATGFRVSEALSISTADILKDKDIISDKYSYWVKVLNGKGDKQRVVPMANIAYKSLENYLGSRPFSTSVVWVNVRGKQLSRVWAFKIVKKYLNVSPHSLRHSYATSMILAGADLRVVQELLGHSSINTTQIYSHIQQKSLSKTVFEHHPLSRE